MIYAITGHPRCGTAYMAALMQRFGFNSEHEHTMGRDVTVAWSWATLHPGPFMPTRRFHDAKGVVRRVEAIPRPRDAKLIHVVRDPNAALYSIAYAYNDPPVVEYLDRFRVWLPSLSQMDNAALSWMSWNKLIDAQAPDLTVRVEDAPAVLSKYLDRPIPDNLPSTRTNSRKKNTDRRPPEDLSELRPDILEALTIYARRYGYVVRGAPCAKAV